MRGVIGWVLTWAAMMAAIAVILGTARVIGTLIERLFSRIKRRA